MCKCHKLEFVCHKLEKSKGTYLFHMVEVALPGVAFPHQEMLPFHKEHQHHKVELVELVMQHLSPLVVAFFVGVLVAWLEPSQSLVHQGRDTSQFAAVEVGF